VGDHTLIFGGIGERFEITHRAHSRDTFARAARACGRVGPRQSRGALRHGGRPEGREMRFAGECPPQARRFSSSEATRGGASGGSATPSTGSPAKRSCSPSPGCTRASRSAVPPAVVPQPGGSRATGIPRGTARAREAARDGGGPPRRRPVGPADAGRRHPPSGGCRGRRAGARDSARVDGAAPDSASCPPPKWPRRGCSHVRLHVTQMLNACEDPLEVIAL